MSLNIQKLNTFVSAEKPLLLNGLGYLPCPDVDNNGSAGGACSFADPNTTIGRLPNETLEVSALRAAAVPVYGMHYLIITEIVPGLNQ